MLPDYSANIDSRQLGLLTDLNPLHHRYMTAHTQTELNAFHLDRLCKMPLSGFDPRMLLVFFCKYEAERLHMGDKVTEVFTILLH